MSAHRSTPRTLNETISIAVAEDGSGSLRMLPVDHQVASAATGAAPAADRPEIDRPSLLKSLGLDDHVSARRFRLRGLLGMGSTGQVFEIDDADLARASALKMLQGERPDREGLKHFIDEARITASLTHPHVLPIYDIGMATDGRIYFTMPRIEGRSLGTILNATDMAAASARGLLDDPNALVTVIIAIAQVLAYAHHRRIVHQDVKPDNIMVGDFGEIWLLDWGSAVRTEPGAKPRLYGTPLYMSPEQARAEHVEPRSDIYCLGATMFHALVGRCPTWSTDPDEFWRKKRAGLIDAPSPQERARVPAVLLDIALKAMAADTALRYASAEALVSDLQAYQRGQAVTAHREGLLEFAGRLWRSHGRRWSAVAAVVALIAVLVGMLYGEKVKEIARWGRPILVDDFGGQACGPQWHPVDGGFRVEDGRLVSQRGTNLLLLDHRLSGPTAIEYDAEIAPGSHRGDISLIWCSERTIDAKGKASVTQAIRCQLGAFDGAYSGIQAGNLLVAFSAFKPEFGRIYHVRDEIVGDRVSMSIDGRPLCSWRSQFPLDDGYVELFATYAHHSFSHLRVFSQGVAQKVSATAIGDSLVELRRYDDAAQAYARVAVSFADTELGHEALFREGVCRWRLSQWQEAFAAWSSLKGTPQEGDVELYALKRDFAAKRYDDVVAGLERLCAGASPELLHEIALAWGEQAEALCLNRDSAHIKLFLAVHDRCLADQAEVDGQCADCLLNLDRYDEVLSRFPSQDHACVLALGAQQRWLDIVTRYPDQLWNYNLALLNAAIDDRVEGDLDSIARAQMLLRTCQFEELMKRPDCDEEQCFALLYQGKFDDLERRHCPFYIHDDVLALTGHVDQVSDEFSRLFQQDHAAAAQRCMAPHSERWEEAQLRIGLEEFIASGDISRLDLVKPAQARVGGDLVEHLAFGRVLLTPFLKGLKGGWAVFDAAVALAIRDDRYQYQQQMWYAACWLRGDLDDQSFLKQPHRLFAPARLALIAGMRAERAGRTVAALAAYRGWQAMPAWQRDFELDPTLIRFVAWRCERLVATH